MSAGRAATLFSRGYLAGTADVTTEFDSKTELDFRNRLVAKFAIPRTKAFWGSGFDQIPATALLPRGDQISDLCSDLRSELRDELQPGDLGEFIKEWALLEEYLVEEARRLTERNVSVREAITSLAKRGVLNAEQAATLDALRKFRNALVHQPKTVSPSAVEEWIGTVRQLRLRLLKGAV
jgi:Protein of unknown function DUF86